MKDSGSKNASPSDKDGDGVRVTEYANHGSRSVLFYKLLAVILVISFATYVGTMMFNHAESGAVDIADASSVSGTTSSSSSDVGNSVGASSSAAGNQSGGQITARPAHASKDPDDLANYVAPGQAPRMEEVIDRLHDAGIHTGLGAFNPPGTSPPMIGLAVPDDYVLPEGYVRHFQATDDGQRIEPILMFSPDFDFFDSTGQRIAIPENRVVPSNMAPPGLVIRPIEIPEPLEPGGP